jgi:hypothetical protein
MKTTNVTAGERKEIIRTANDQGRSFVYAYLNNINHCSALLMLRAVRQT